MGEEISAPRAGGADDLYNAALTAFNRGNNTTARMAFERFLTAYPNHAMAPHAKYYLADILTQENRLDEAIDAFLEITELFPTAERVPFALYRIGVLYIELEDLEQGRIYLQRVVNTYPDSGAALVARERLEEIS
jgi:tol-pal system protein YbgF